jgi:NDP-sugar pyrophosphorylase family protein
MLNIIITMAGIGSRFRKVGYKLPKFMIEAKGTTLFEWAMKSLESFNRNDVKYYFISRKEDNATSFIFDKCKKLGIDEYQIIELDYDTSGQAETAYIAIKECNANDGVMIYNIDTYVDPNYLSYEDLKGDGCLPCFNAPGEHWSFAKTDSYGNVVEVREKTKISDYATLGIYYFKSAKLYIDLYDKFYEGNQNLEKNERYVAPMYNQLIKDGGHVFITEIPKEKVDVLGTPEELDSFIRK